MIDKFLVMVGITAVAGLFIFLSWRLSPMGDDKQQWSENAEFQVVTDIWLDSPYLKASTRRVKIVGGLVYVGPEEPEGPSIHPEKPDMPAPGLSTGD